MISRSYTQIVLVCLLSFVPGVMGAQEFRVLAVRGTVSAGAGAVKVGSRLKASDKLTVGPNGYVGMAHSNGRTVEVRKAGSYKLADLDKRAKAKGNSASAKFASYVYGELTDVEEPIVFQDVHRGKMKRTGAVDRAGDDADAVENLEGIVGGLGEARSLAAVASSSLQQGASIVAIAPRHSRLLDDSVTFCWHRCGRASSYTLTVTDRENRAVFQRTTTDTVLTVRTSEWGMMEGNLYFWHVVSASDATLRSEEFDIFRLAGEERLSTEGTLTAIRDEIDDRDAAIGQLILAAACEDLGLTYDAYRAYRAAIAAAPDVANIKRLYAQFLRRQNLHLDAWEAYN